jgi:hypothetical protein
MQADDISAKATIKFIQALYSAVNCDITSNHDFNTPNTCNISPTALSLAPTSELGSVIA